jgi:hypothetical protein
MYCFVFVFIYNIYSVNSVKSLCQNVALAFALHLLSLTAREQGLEPRLEPKGQNHRFILSKVGELLNTMH